MSETAATTQELRQQIYNTVAYFDLFDFAPTLMEIERWLLSDNMRGNSSSTTPSLSAIQATLTQDKRIQQKEAYFFLKATPGEHDRSHLPHLHKEKYIHSTQKWRHSKRFLKLLASMPHVRGIWFANSVAWGNAREGSDIDLLIVTSPEHIWTARFFTTFWMRLFRQRPHETDHSKALCLSFYVSSDHLDLEQYKIADHDVHYTFWATQFYPLYDNGTYKQYMDANPWLTESFAREHHVEQISKRAVTLANPLQHIKKMLEKLPLENILKKLQLRILPEPLANPEPDSGVVISNTILKLHTNDNRAAIQKQWQSKIETASQ